MQNSLSSYLHMYNVHTYTIKAHDIKCINTAGLIWEHVNKNVHYKPPKGGGGARGGDSLSKNMSTKARPCASDSMIIPRQTSKVELK